MPHILIVCTANICRSPVAEAILREQFQANAMEGWTVSSAGTWAIASGQAADNSRILMAERGLDISGHRAKMVDAAVLARADLVLCLGKGHAEALRVEFPPEAGKIYLLSEMIDKSYTIADPYGQDIDSYREMVKEVSMILDEGFPRIIFLAEGQVVPGD